MILQHFKKILVLTSEETHTDIKVIKSILKELLSTHHSIHRSRSADAGLRAAGNRPLLALQLRHSSHQLSTCLNQLYTHTLAVAISISIGRHFFSNLIFQMMDL